MGRKRKSNSIYFSKDTDNAIIAYNKETNPIKRELIYRDHIKYPMEKLAEYIINTFKFPYLTETLKNKKVEVVSHLILNLDKFDETKGKAFSYFSKAAKTYLIIKNDASYNKSKKHYYLDNSMGDDDDSFSMSDVLEDNSLEEAEDQSNMKNFIKELNSFFDKNIPYIFKKERDRKIAFAVLHLMAGYEMIENFNKKAIYLVLRDMTNESATTITRVLSIMKELYVKLSSEYIENGSLKRFEYDIKNDWIK